MPRIPIWVHPGSGPGSEAGIKQGRCCGVAAISRGWMLWGWNSCVPLQRGGGETVLGMGSSSGGQGRRSTMHS
jgi:hypothetical protein